MVAFIQPTAWKTFSKNSPNMMTRENENAILEYRSPRSSTVSDEVNILRKAGMIRMLTPVAAAPWIADRTNPWAAARFAFSFSPAPRKNAMAALIPTPKPMARALIRFCTGYTRERAVMASSLI